MRAMILELSAVRLDGSTPHTRRPTAQSVRWPRGFSGTVRVICVNEDGTPTDVTGRRQRLTIRRFLTDAQPLICLESTTWDFEISGTLANQITGRAFYDVIQVDEDDGERFEVVLTGPWEFLATASVIGDLPTDPVGELIPPPIQGEPGADGLSILHGAGPPDPDLGRNDEFYIDDTSVSRDLYGPKTAGDWGSPFPLAVGAALSDADPEPGASVAASGTGVLSSRDDHVHPYTIAIAGGADGWMSGTMAQQLAGLVSADFGTQITNVAGDLATLTTTVGGHTTTLASHTSSISDLQGLSIVGGAGLVGGGAFTGTGPLTLTIGQNADGSITVNANDIQLSTTLQTAISTATSDIASLTGTVAGLSAVYVPQTRTITPGAGLVGSSALDLSANRTFTVGANADGSITVNADDIQVGILATDAQHGSRGGGGLHADVVAGGASGFMTGAQATQLVTNTTALDYVAANWAITTAGVQRVRYYLIDNDGGDDNNVGYVDAAAGATLVPAGLALKTLERLFQILPKLGNGRWVVVLCKARAAGATYLKQDNVTSDSILTAGIFGYSYIRFSGSTDLTNSASDQITQGFEQIAVGPNGDGSFSIGGSSTTTLLNFAAGTVSADPAVVQYRVRFSPTTTTVALRNQCRVITTNATGSATLGNALSATPTSAGTADNFFIERPGFSVDKVDWSQGTPQDSPSGFLFYNIITGVRCTSTQSAGFTVSAPSSIVVGCEQSVNQAAGVPSFRDMFSAGIRDAYTSEASAGITLGMGLRAGSPVVFARIASLNVQCLGMMRVGGTTSFSAVYSTNGGFGNRCYSAGIVDARACGVTGGANLGETFGFVIGDTSATNAAFRVVAGQISFSQSSGGVRRLDFASCTTACIKLTGMGCTLVVDGCTGTSGNTDVGIDMSAAVASTLIAGRSSANTVSGTSGDIKVAGTAIATHAGLTLTGFEDNACNKILGTGLPFAAGAQLVSNQSGGAVAVGDLMRGNATTGQVTSSQATTNAGTAAVIGVMVTAAASAANGYMAGPGGYRYVLFDGTPTAGAIAYVSPGTIRKATTTVPAVSGTNQKSRLGRVVNLSGSTGVVAFNPEALATTADGNA